MTGRRRSLPRLMILLGALGIAAPVAGCGKTLAFVERDGVNLAIRANASSSPPIEVNFGLNRTIATIVPPTGENGNKPSGEAVSMFAGFQIDNTLDPSKVAGDLQIVTQFASGAAAVGVAGNPAVVAQIVNVNSTTIQRTPGYVSTLGERKKLVAAIKGLSDAQVVAVAAAMLPALSTRSADLQRYMAPDVAALPKSGRIPPAMARSILSDWASNEEVNPESTAEWTSAFAQAKP